MTSHRLSGRISGGGGGGCSIRRRYCLLPRALGRLFGSRLPRCAARVAVRRLCRDALLLLRPHTCALTDQHDAHVGQRPRATGAGGCASPVLMSAVDTMDTIHHCTLGRSIANREQLHVEAGPAARWRPVVLCETATLSAAVRPLLQAWRTDTCICGSCVTIDGGWRCWQGAFGSPSNHVSDTSSPECECKRCHAAGVQAVRRSNTGSQRPAASRLAKGRNFVVGMAAGQRPPSPGGRQQTSCSYSGTFKHCGCSGVEQTLYNHGAKSLYVLRSTLVMVVAASAAASVSSGATVLEAACATARGACTQLLQSLGPAARR